MCVCGQRVMPWTFDISPYPMSTLLSLAVLIGCSNQMEGSGAVSGANALCVTNILLSGGRLVTLAMSPEDPVGTGSASRKRPSY